MAMPSLPSNLQRVPQGMGSPDLAGLMRPSEFAQAASTANLLQINPNQPFFLRHHPNAWRVSTTLAVPLLLPDVTKHVIAPGVNGIRTRGKHEPPEATYRSAIMDQTMKHWTYLDPAAPIPANCLPDGVPAGSYIREMGCQGLIVRAIGKYYAEAWQVPIQTLPNAKQRFRFDSHKYERWLRFLVESGQIAPALDGILEAKRSQVRDHRDRVETMNLNEAIAKKWLGVRQVILDNYDAATPAERLTPDAVQAILDGYTTDADADDAPKKKGRK